MSSKKLLALALLILAGILLLEFFPTGRPSQPGEALGRAQGEKGAGESGSGDLASLDRTGASPEGAPTTRIAEALAALEISPATPGPTRQVRVEVAWPTGGAPSIDPAALALTALALDEEIRGISLLRAVQSDAPPGSQRRQLGEELFEDLTEDWIDDVRGGILARAPFTLEPDGRWVAEMTVPERNGRIHVHAVGAGYYSERAANVGVTERATTLALAHAALLDVRVTTDLAGVDPAATCLRLKEFEDGPSAYARGAEGRPALRLDLALAGDATGAVTVPAGIPIEVVGRHPRAALAVGPALTLAPGEERTIDVALVAGNALAGRVVTPDGEAPPTPARVLVLRPGSTFGFDDIILRETETDGEGRFRAEGLEGDTFAVFAAAPGYREGRSAQLTSSDGAPLPDVVVELQTGAAIRGRLVGADGLATDGVRVEARFDTGFLVGPSSLAAMNGAFAAATSDGEGAFVLAGLGSGPFTVEAFDANGTVVARGDNVLPGDEELVLELAEPSFVEGIVLGENERAVPRLGVTLARVQDGSLGELRIPRADVLTDELGRFRFEGVGAGTYELWSRTETHASVEAKRIVVRQGEAQETTLVVPRAASAAGVVVGPDGAPIENARVSVITDHPAWMPPAFAGPDVETTRTDEDGRFELLGLPASGTRLRAEKDDYASVESAFFELRAGETRTRLQLALTRGGTIEGICFDEEGRTAKHRIVTVNSMSISTSRTVRAGEDGTFRVSGLSPGAYQLVALDPESMSVASGSAGSMTDLMKHMRMARADVREGETTLVFLGTPDPSEVRVTGRVTQRGRPVPGRLLTWSPATDEIKEGTRSAETDARGEYSLLVDEPGDYFVQVLRMGSGPGLAETFEARARIAPGETEARVDFPLPAGRIAGRVFGPDGAPLSGARVSLLEHGGVPLTALVGRCYGEITTGGDGRFVFDTVDVGEYRLGVGGAGILGDTPSAPARVQYGPFQIGPDEALDDVEIRLPEPGSLRVRVVAGSGDPVPEAAVFLRDAEGHRIEHVSMATTNSAGVLVVHGLAPGAYTAMARGPALVTEESLPVEVEPGETARIDLVATTGGAIAVKVRGDGELDLSDTRIQILDGEGRDVAHGLGPHDIDAAHPSGALPPDERRFGTFAPGVYRVIATAPSGATAAKPVRIDAGDERVVLRLR